MESREVAQFREHVLSGRWADAEEALIRLCVVTEDEIWVRIHHLIRLSSNSPSLLLGGQISYQPTKVSRATGSADDHGCFARVEERARSS
jgi:hypothetical protein